jgi:hypothetical protein
MMADRSQTAFGVDMSDSLYTKVFKTGFTGAGKSAKD